MSHALFADVQAGNQTVRFIMSDLTTHALLIRHLHIFVCAHTCHLLCCSTYCLLFCCRHFRWRAHDSHCWCSMPSPCTEGMLCAAGLSPYQPSFGTSVVSSSRAAALLLLISTRNGQACGLRVRLAGENTIMIEQSNDYF